ncbi:MAG: hypothetical protein R3B06_10360 [Kofleriaceae bacterium]
MGPRFVNAILAAAASVLLALAAFSPRWFTADLRTDTVNANLRIGLTSLRACVAGPTATACDKVSWDGLPRGMPGGGWMWIGKLEFILLIALAIALAAVAALAVGDIEMRGAISLPRITLLLGMVAGALAALYYLMAPAGLAMMSAGRAFAMAGGGVVLAIVASHRLKHDPDR